MMTSNHKAPSIEIKRIDAESMSPPLPDQGAPRGRDGTDHPPDDGDVELLKGPDEDNPHVMVTLSLEDDQHLDLNAWEQWLASFPALAKHVKVQGVFKSHSTLLLLSLPVMVWDMLPDDPACSFIAFIRSDNLISSKQPQQKTIRVSVPGMPDAVPDAVVSSDQVVRDTRTDMSAVPQPRTSPTSIDVHQGIPDSENRLTVAPVATQDHDSVSSQRARKEAAEDMVNASKDRYPTSYRGTTVIDVPHTTFTEPDLDDDGVSVLSVPTYHEVDSPVSHIAEPDERFSRPTTYGTQASSRSRTQQQDHSSPSTTSRTLVNLQLQSGDYGNNPREGPKLAKHVVQRLEEYFQESPYPDSSVTAFFASSLGINTRDVDVSAVP
jgi:hypothetical protein